MVEWMAGVIRRHPRVFDAIVALFWGLLALADLTDGVDFDGRAWLLGATIFLAVLLALSLWWRRRHSVLVFAFQAAVVIVLTLFDVDSAVPATVICAIYSLAAHTESRRVSIWSFVGFIAVGLLTVLLMDPAFLPDSLVIVLFLAIAWVIGDSLRTRRAYQQSILDRAERAEALRDSLAHQAVAEERTRIARDLHDVVAHSMSLMVVQAAAARRVAKTDPEASERALEAIESVGRNSLNEMRRILGVLRGDDTDMVMAPQPDIAAIDGLAEEFRAAGLPVEVKILGEPRALQPTIELTAFRIVQESLTNVLKHAGTATAEVILDFTSTELKIAIGDNGRGTTGASSVEPGSQKGHVGMRERVAAFGGTFVAGPHSSGGYEVAVSLPILDEDLSSEQEMTQARS